jgi:hypothetical protein
MILFQTNFFHRANNPDIYIYKIFVDLTNVALRVQQKNKAQYIAYSSRNIIPEKEALT